MEREIRTWWNELNRSDQAAWMSAWEADTVTDETSLTMPSEWRDQWTTGEAPRRPSPQLADFLEQQAAGRFLNAGETVGPEPG